MRAAVLAALAMFAVAPAIADGDIHGRLEVQDFAAFARDDSLDAFLHARNRNDVASNLRLTWEPSRGRWSVSVHAVVAADYGDGVRLARAESGLLPTPPATWFDLTSTRSDQGNIRAQAGIDRLSVSYASQDFVVRIGRQALTWGGGLVFRPMDLFDPFSPSATDTEFKPGTDMVYAQWLFGDGSDLQAIVAPRPAVKGGGPSTDASSFALHYRTTIGPLTTAWLVARDHGDWTAALQFGGPLGGATWDVDVVPVFLAGGGTRISAVANISTATTLFDRNATVFAEAFHNGFGSGAKTLAALPSDLIDRLARGQVFNLRKNYLAAGATLEVTPLLTFSPVVIGDVGDGSFHALASVTYSLSDEMTLIAGAQVPVGSRGSEYGGIALSPLDPHRVGASPQIYLQLRRYF